MRASSDSCNNAAVDHWNAECVGWHVCKVGNRFAALEPIAHGLRQRYGSVDADVARGLGRWCADAGRPTRFKPSSPSPTDAVRDGSAKLGHLVQNVTREHGLTPVPR